jgi:cytochrome c-type biogenesis protein CcmH
MSSHSIYRALVIVCFVGAFFTPTLSYSEEAKAIADNPALEAQVMDIASELRCLVCQNETIAGSHADLALDLRNQIRQQLLEGKSKQEIMLYMVDRYGDFVLYKPPVQTNTFVLWFAPFILLIVGLFVLIRHTRLKPAPFLDPQSNEDDLERARQLLVANKKDSE